MPPFPIPAGAPVCIFVQTYNKTAKYKLRMFVFNYKSHLGRGEPGIYCLVDNHGSEGQKSPSGAQGQSPGGGCLRKAGDKCVCELYRNTRKYETNKYVISLCNTAVNTRIFIYCCTSGGQWENLPPQRQEGNVPMPPLRTPLYLDLLFYCTTHEYF